MLRQEPLFKLAISLVGGIVLLAGASTAFGETSASGYQKREASLYQDIFDQNVYYEGTQYLHLERLYRNLFGLRNRALNVNAFDEVPNSLFFTNRHGREPMSVDALKQGSAVTSGPDPGGKWTITKGKFEGMSPGFFIHDEKGDRYLLKFDPVDYIELPTGAEAVGSRFLHAIGYNVPQYTLVYFKKDQLAIEPGARIYDQSGFRRKLTPERLEEFLLFVPETERGFYRASASRIVEGEALGPMKLQGRRRNDPDDLVNHEDRREIRALQVFSSWLNNYDVRESNTLDVVEEKDGRRSIRHYLIDFNSSLGARAGGPKPPQFGHEHIFDYGETLKAFLSFGFWKKPWQKRWDEAGREVRYPTLGYFDNRYFNPGRYKTQLPYFPFKDLTRADGFWAAKTVLRFTDDEIAAIVSTGELSDPEAEKTLAQTLIERRDLIGRFWFEHANPLDEFRLLEEGEGSYELRFEDLAVRYGFEPEGKSVYRFEVIGKKGKRGILLARKEVQENRFKIESDWLRQSPSLDLLVQTEREGKKGRSPRVRVTLRSEEGKARLVGILHQD